MRLAANPKEPDYRPEARHASVLFNGLAVKHCTFADEEAGLIRHFVDTGRGLVTHMDAGKFRVLEVEARGAVYIRLPSRPRPRSRPKRRRR